MIVAPHIVEIIGRAAADGRCLTLMDQLDRAVYDQVDRALRAAGGKWDRRARAHVFEGDAAGAIDPILLTGEITPKRQELGQFFTPPEIVGRVVELARLEEGMVVLEPSAGRGSLAFAAADRGCRVMCYEIDPRNCDHLVRENAGRPARLDMVVEADFLRAGPVPVYDRVVMNPPFARQADIAHVTHAAAFLKPSGRLVAIMSASILFRGNKVAAGFRDMLDRRGAAIEPLPSGAFRGSGTNVAAVIVSYGGGGAAWA